MEHCQLQDSLFLMFCLQKENTKEPQEIAKRDDYSLLTKDPLFKASSYKENINEPW